MSTKRLAQQVVPGANGAESATAEDGAVRPRDSFFHWSATADATRQSRKPADKIALVQSYFESVAEETIGPAARFLAGVVFQRHGDGTTIVSRSLIVDVIQDLTRIPPAEFRERYVKHGDLGDAAAEIFAGRLPSGIAVVDVMGWSDELAAVSGTDERRDLVREMLSRLSGLEAQYLVRLVGGDLHIGLKETHIEEALAKAFDEPLAAVRHANRILGDIGEAARLARRHALDGTGDGASGNGDGTHPRPAIDTVQPFTRAPSRALDRHRDDSMSKAGKRSA
jgi:DNA ligase-1